MTIREIIEKARAAQQHPLQLMLFPPRLAPWDDCICRKGAWNPDCPKHPKLTKTN